MASNAFIDISEGEQVVSLVLGQWVDLQGSDVRFRASS